MPVTHFIMIIFNFITNNPKLNMDGAKQLCSFAGMLLVVNLIMQITQIMFIFP